jgi:hypothetical protein
VCLYGDKLPTVTHATYTEQESQGSAGGYRRVFRGEPVDFAARCTMRQAAASLVGRCRSISTRLWLCTLLRTSVSRTNCLSFSSSLPALSKTGALRVRSLATQPQNPPHAIDVDEGYRTRLLKISGKLESAMWGKPRYVLSGGTGLSKDGALPSSRSGISVCPEVRLRSRLRWIQLMERDTGRWYGVLRTQT